MGDRLRTGIPSRYVTSQLDQLSLVSLRGRFGWCKGGNVTSVVWQVTLCDPVWYASFYRAMLCIRGTSHGPVSVCVRVCPCLSQAGVLLKRQNVGSHKQHQTIPPGTLVF